MLYEAVGTSVFFAIVATVIVVVVLFGIIAATGGSFREVMGCIYVVAVVVGCIILGIMKMK